MLRRTQLSQSNVASTEWFRAAWKSPHAPHASDSSKEISIVPYPKTAVNWPLVARVVGTLVFVVVLLVTVPLSQVADAVMRADPSWAVVGVILSLLARFAAAERTFSLSKPMHLAVSRKQTVETLFISNFWSLLLPGLSAGAVATVYRYRRLGISFGLSVGALAVSRIVEAVVYCALTTMAWIVLAASAAVDGSRAALIASIGGAVLLLLLGSGFFLRSLSPGTSVAAAANVSSFSARLLNVALVLRRVSPRAYFLASTFAALQALLDAASVATFARALAIPLDLISTVWVNGVAYFAILLPISIAGLGARDAAVVAATAPLNISVPDALAIAVSMFAATIVNALVGGVVQFFVAREVPIQSS
jgi:uncharacterized membrane protein YbhN (UPF0104 family)